METINLTIYSDSTCPFCYIGKGIIDQLKQEFPLQAEWLPYEVHPDIPPQGMLLADFAPELEAEEFFAQLNRRGEPMGIHFGVPSLLCNSRQSLEAGEFARAHGLYEAFHEAVFQAYFTHCRDIGKQDVILEIATEAQFDAPTLDALNTALDNGTYLPQLERIREMAKKARVRAAPTFIFEGYGAVTGAQPIESFRNLLQNGPQADDPAIPWLRPLK
ncbi:MAG: DsbA family oxidoreductase [Desulfovibrio sp.]|uniref:DsbA family oxidoreductase n=1 Tax=Desulfovibrio sp. 7SRBS1 TaxID=3378064 RepID=UPI003B3D3F7B